MNNEVIGGVCRKPISQTRSRLRRRAAREAAPDVPAEASWLMEARVHATDAPAGGEDSAAALREGEKSDAFGFGLPERKRKRGAH